jgi:uncharacterized membrane protein
MRVNGKANSLSAFRKDGKEARIYLMIKRAWFLNQSIKEICDFDQFIILFILIYVFVLNFKNITIRKSEFKSFRVKSN